MKQNLRFHQVTISPEDHSCLHNVICYVRRELETKKQDQLENDGPELTYFEDKLLDQVEQLERWKSYVSQSLFETWSDLPDGDHLKHSYRDEVWTWDDQDISQIPEDRKVSPEEVRSLIEDLSVDE